MAKHGSGQRIPTTLVTGFLGGGKTTLINAVLHSAAFANAMVVVNEFGEVGLDHLLMESGQDQVVLLDSGCLCCAVSGSLRDTLIDLFMRRACGDLPAFDRVIIETSGLANPVPLVASLIADSAVSLHYRLSLVLTIVDAENGAATLERYDEALKQVAVADRILISKGERAGVDAVADMRARLAAANVSAEIAIWQRGGDPSPLFADAPVAPDRRSAMPLGFARGPFAGDGAHGRLFPAIRSHVLRVSGATDWPAYAAWTAQMQRCFGRRLLRCKGLLRIGGDEAIWVIQGVQGHFTSPALLDPGVARELTDGQLDFLVCIGEQISGDQLQATIPLLGTADKRRTSNGSSSALLTEHQ